MKISRRSFLVVLLIGCLAAGAVLLKMERPHRQGQSYSRLHHAEQNYSLIEDGLYQGGDVVQPPPGTKAVLNLCEMPDPYRTEVYRWEAIADSAPAPDIDWLRRMVEFVDSQRREGRTTYVHCAAGVSRSGMVVTAYAMYKNHWTLDQALAFVRSKRPETNPNPAFMKLLGEWERVLQGHRVDATPGQFPGRPT